MKTLLTTSLIAFAFVVGSVAPDVDQRLPLLTYRSLLTHGPWFAVLAMWLAQKSRSQSAVPLTAGSFAMGWSSIAAPTCFQRHGRGLP